MFLWGELRRQLFLFYCCFDLVVSLFVDWLGGIVTWWLRVVDSFNVSCVLVFEFGYLVFGNSVDLF